MIRRLGEARRSVHVVDPDRTCKNEASSQLVCAADMENNGKRWSDDSCTHASPPRCRRRGFATKVRDQDEFQIPKPYLVLLRIDSKLN